MYGGMTQGVRYHDAAQSLCVWFHVSPSLCEASDATGSACTTRPLATTAARRDTRLQEDIRRDGVERPGDATTTQ